MSNSSPVRIKDLPLDLDAYCGLDAAYEGEEYTIPGAGHTVSTFLRHNAIAYPERTVGTRFRVRRHPDGFDLELLTGDEPAYYMEEHEADPPLWVKETMLRRA
jgi:hypothetical protein